MDEIELMQFAWTMLGINLLIVFYPILFIPFQKLWKIITIKRETVKSCMSDGTMEREINLNYSPAFISLLLDRKIEAPKDLLADILNLMYKKVLRVDMESSDNQRLLIDYENLKSTKISKEELYIIKHIENNLNGNNSAFNFEIFEQEAKKQFVEDGFDINDKVKKYLKGLPKALMYAVRNWAVIILMPSIIWTVFYTAIPVIANIKLGGWEELIFQGFGMFILMPVSAFIVMGICIWLGKRIKNVMKPPIVLSEKGKVEYAKILKFKYFLEEYTLIKDKKIDSMILLDWYIPYAVALGINKGYKKDIEEILAKINLEKIFLDVFKYELKRNFIV